MAAGRRTVQRRPAACSALTSPRRRHRSAKDATRRLKSTEAPTEPASEPVAPAGHESAPPATFKHQFSTHSRSGPEATAGRSIAMVRRTFVSGLTIVALLTVPVVPGSASSGAGSDRLARIQHIVVIYEENHSFDNLYGSWEGV